MKRVIEEMEKKYYSYGEIRGNLVLDNLEEEEVKALSFLGFLIKGDNMKIPVLKLGNSIGVEDSNQLKELVENVLERSLVYRKEEEKDRIASQKKLLTEVISKIKTRDLKDYLKTNQSILKLSFGDKLIKLLDNLNEDNYETLGNFSGKLVGDPHLLDVKSSCYNQLIKYLKYLKGIDNKPDLEEEKELLLKFGLTINPLNTTIISFGFKAYKKNGQESLMLKGALEEKEDINLNLSNIVEFERIVSYTSRLLILENPNAYIAVKELIDSMSIPLSLICTGGELNQSAYLFLEKLENKEKEVYYSGDIDPEGILIAQRIKRRFPWIKLVGFESDIYEKYRSDIEIGNKSLAKLKNVELHMGIGYEVIKKVEERKQPAYQELFYQEIIDIII